MAFTTRSPLDPVRPSRRRLLAAGLGALAVPVLGACDSGTPARPQASGTPRVSAAPPNASGSGTPTASGSGSGSEAPESSASPSIPVSDDLDDITVSGDPGSEPTVEVPKPWGVDKTRVKVLDEGDGPTVPESGPVTVHYHGVNGRSGDMFDSSWVNNDGNPITFSLTAVIAGFQIGLAGQKVGSRVLIAVPGEDGYDEQGGQPPDILVGDTLLFVCDIVDTLRSGPTGEEVEPEEDLPEVTDDDGVPTISMPDDDPPSTLTIQPLIKGDGREVTETDTVYLHYRGALWEDGEVVDDNFGDDAESTALDDSLIPGFTEGLIGQTVGSRMLLVIPPEDGYPEGNATPAVPEDATLVYVVDILFAQAPQ